MAGLFEFSTRFFCCCSSDDTIDTSSSDWSLKAPEEVEFLSLEENFGLFLGANLLIFESGLSAIYSSNFCDVG